VFIPKNMNAKLFLQIVIILLALASPASAAFISGDIEISDTGKATFDIRTDTNPNIPGLSFENEKLSGSTNTLTSKEGDIWSLSLDLGEYDEIFLQIHLPKGLQEITSINGPDHIIDLEKKVIVIIAAGKLNFQVSYKSKETNSYIFLIWTLLAIAIILFFILYKKKNKQKERLDNILPLINDTEKKIIDLLMKGQMRQKEIRKKLDIPKASFSRYMANLEKKKLILREGEGKNKIVKLK